MTDGQFSEKRGSHLQTLRARIRNEARFILSTQDPEVTCVPHDYMELSARWMWTGAHFFHVWEV